MPVVFVYSNRLKKYYFFSAFVSVFTSAFAAQQAFLSLLLHSAAFAQVSFFSVFLVVSFVDADTVEAANPIVNAIAKTNANFFMISILK
jgi:hypothetical protein